MRHLVVILGTKQNLFLLPTVSQVCEHMSDFYIHDIILENQFSPQGCEQVQIDIEKGMNAIFSQHVMQNDPKLQGNQLSSTNHIFNTGYLWCASFK